MPLVAGALALVAADQAAKAIGDGIDQLGRGPEYVKSGTPESIPGKLGLAIARSACRRYGEGDFNNLSDRAAGGYENACRPYLDSINPGAGPLLRLPFRGGQCVTNYRLTYDTSNKDGPITNGIVRTRQGPLSVFRETAPPATGGGQPTVLWRLRYGAAGTVETLLLGAENVDPRVSFTSIVRVDGAADNCGNPSPVVEPPDKIPRTIPNPEPFKPSPDIDVNLDVTLNIDGSINFNIGVGVPIIIRPKFGPDEDGDGDGGDGGGTAPPPSPPAPEPGPEVPGGNGGFGGDDNFGAPPAGRRWVGACLRITQRPTNQPPIPGSVPEDVYASVVGNVRLVFNAAGTRQTDTPIRIRAKHVCVWEPVSKLNPVGISVDLLPGFSYVYRPYSVPAGD